MAGRGGVKAPPPRHEDQSQQTVHVIQSIEQAPNLAEQPRSVALMRDSYERMYDTRRRYGNPMDVLGLDPGKGRLPAKPPPTKEQIYAYHRSLDEQRRIEGARVLKAADRWVATREQQREEVANERAAAELRHAQAEAVVSAEMQQEILKQTVESGELRLRSLEEELCSERREAAHGRTAREEATLIEMAHELVDAGLTTRPFYRQVITELSELMPGHQIVRESVAQSSQAIEDVGGPSPIYDEVIAEL